MSNDRFTDCTYDESFVVNEDIRAAFDDNGYIIVRSILNSKELSVLRTALRNDDGVKSHSYVLSATEKGRKIHMCLWNHPGNDVTGMVARSEKVAGTMEKLLGGEVYHFSSKLIMKDARTGGKHVWHQDYGYWYHNGCLFPDMGSVFLAIDKCTRQNGCLQILKSSHKMGRIDHIAVGGQTGADMERVNHAMKQLQRIQVELEPGDAIFFHCNVLHTSNRNDSDDDRWVMISAYNRASNDPVDSAPFPQFTPLNKVPNDVIERCPNPLDMTGKDFLDPTEDKNVKVDTEKK